VERWLLRLCMALRTPSLHREWFCGSRTLSTVKRYPTSLWAVLDFLVWNRCCRLRLKGSLLTLPSCHAGQEEGAVYSSASPSRAKPR